jgi:glyoxylate reductase
MTGRGFGVLALARNLFRKRDRATTFRAQTRRSGGDKMTGKVLVTGTSVADHHLSPLREAGLAIDNPTELLSEQQLGERLKDAAAYLLGGDEIATRKALEKAKKLKIVAFLGVGYESFIDVKAASELGIAVTNTPGTLSQSVAEFTIAQAINATRRLSVYGNFIRSEATNTATPVEEKRHDLSALSVGILGLGAIGTRVAEVLTLGLGCSVSYWSRTRKPVEEARLSLEYLELDAILAKSQILFLLLPGNSETRNLIGPRQFALMKRGTILINTARAELVEPGALLSALQDGRLDTAVFDGFFDEEVSQRANLLALPQEKLLVTRHIASLTHEARDGMARKAVGSILNLLKTGQDPNVVNNRQ